jgi:hypothetical protein
MWGIPYPNGLKSFRVRVMRIHRRVSVLASLSLIAFITGVVIPASAQANLPAAESNLFILDVSGSTNSTELWKTLKISATSKLSQPFGHPIANGIPKKLPVYVSITSIAKNSQNSPTFSIVTKADAKKIWGAVEQVFPNSTDSRLKRITDEIFGDSGVWASQARIFTRSTIVVPTSAACRTSTLNAIGRGSFLRNTDQQKKNVLASAICERVISIAKSMNQANAYFSNPVCDPNAICSDIAGAIYRATNMATDLANADRDTVNGRLVKNKLCIAIASDMLNESPGVSRTSVLNSKHIALTAATLEKARAAGMSAAKSVGIRFPTEVETRVVMVGIGTGQNPLPLDRNSFLLAYWEGFFTESGVKQTDQAQSLNQACS